MNEPQAPLKAYHNPEFLDSPAARPIRILSEYLEPTDRLPVESDTIAVSFRLAGEAGGLPVGLALIHVSGEQTVSDGPVTLSPDPVGLLAGAVVLPRGPNLWPAGLYEVRVTYDTDILYRRLLVLAP